MFQEMMIANGSSGGGTDVDWIGATSYPARTMNFEWDYSANAVIVEGYLDLGGGRNGWSLFYIDLSNPNVIRKGVCGTVICNNTSASTAGVSITATDKTLSISHSNYNWSNAYVLPLVDSTII